MVIPLSKEFEKGQDLYVASEQATFHLVVRSGSMSQTAVRFQLDSIIYFPFGCNRKYSIPAPRLADLTLQEADSLNLSINFISVNKVGFLPASLLGKINSKTSGEAISWLPRRIGVGKRNSWNSIAVLGKLLDL